MTIPLKDCDQCSHYRGGFCYGFGVAKRVFSTAEAIICGNFTPLGQVQIGPLESLAGQLKTIQIPDAIISTLKLADLAVSTAKLSNAAVTAIKIANGVIADAKIAAGAGILESKLNLDYGTQALHNDIATRALQATYAVHDHSVADPTQVDHANLINVLASQHHVKTTSISDLTDHNKANHDSLDIDADTLDTKHYSDISAEIDADILTHKNLASAHHVKYTNPEAVTAIEAADPINLKTVTIGADCNLYRSAENQLKTDDEFNAGGGLRISGVIVDWQKTLDLIMHGAAQVAWVPMAFAGSNDTSITWSNWGGYFRNLGADDMHPAFTLAIPFVKSTLAMTVTDLRIVVVAADADDYISRVRCWSDGVIKLDDGTDLTSPDTYDFDVTDCNPTHSFMCYLDCVNMTTAELQFVVLAKCYYS